MTCRGLRTMLPDAAPQWREVLRVFVECDTLHCREAAVGVEQVERVDQHLLQQQHAAPGVHRERGRAHPRLPRQQRREVGLDRLEPVWC